MHFHTVSLLRRGSDGCTIPDYPGVLATPEQGLLVPGVARADWRKTGQTGGKTLVVYCKKGQRLAPGATPGIEWCGNGLSSYECKVLVKVVVVVFQLQ